MERPARRRQLTGRDLRIQPRFPCGESDSSPYIPSVAVDNARKGFFEPADFEAVEMKLPESLRPFARFLYPHGMALWRGARIDLGGCRLRRWCYTVRTRRHEESGRARVSIRRVANARRSLAQTARAHLSTRAGKGPHHCLRFSPARPTSPLLRKSVKCRVYSRRAFRASRSRSPAHGGSES